MVGIGPYQIRLLPPERGFDLALSIESGESAAAAAPPVAAAPLRIRGGLLARRPLSWLLFAVVLAGFLVLPVVAHLGYQRDLPPDLADGRAGGKPQPTPLAGYDHSWDTGELSDPHKFLQQRCEVCHAQPFTPIRDEDCGACHGTVRHHFADPERTITAALRSAGSSRCDASRATPSIAVPQRRDPAPAGVVRPLPPGPAPVRGRHQARERQRFRPRLIPQFKPTVITDAAVGKVERLELGGASAGQGKLRPRLQPSVPSRA